MKQIDGFNTAEVIKDTPPCVLPPGAHIVVVLGSTLKEGKTGRYLEFDMDVAEGEYKGFFDDLYKNSTADIKRWRCKYFVSIPEETGSDKDMYKLRLFKTFITHIEESNPGYHWDWNEDTLRGKKVGGLFVNNEYLDKTGERRMGTVMAKTCTIQDVIDGTFRMPKDRLLPEAPSGFVAMDKMNTAELPFS